MSAILEPETAIEAALLNARLWLERAVRQRDELRAAEDVASDAESAEDDPALRLIAGVMAIASRR